MGPFGRADRPTLEIGRCFALAPLIHVEGREAKEARTDDRQADNVGCFPRHLRAELRKRQLAHLPLAVEGEAREHFMVSERKPGVVDALGTDDTEAEVSEMIIVGGGDGELDARHSSPLCNLAPGLCLPRQAFTLDGERVWTQNLASTIAASTLKARLNPDIVGWRKRSRPRARAIPLASLVAVDGGAPHIEQEVGAMPGITIGDLPEGD